MDADVEETDPVFELGGERLELAADGGEGSVGGVGIVGSGDAEGGEGECRG